MSEGANAQGSNSSAERRHFSASPKLRPSHSQSVAAPKTSSGNRRASRARSSTSRTLAAVPLASTAPRASSKHTARGLADTLPEVVEQTIYVELLDEGVDVWRPVAAAEEA